MNNHIANEVILLYAEILDPYFNDNNQFSKIWNESIFIKSYFDIINNDISLSWQILPRIIKIWFNSKDDRVKNFINNSLMKLQDIQIVQIIPILLSKYKLKYYRKNSH